MIKPSSHPAQDNCNQYFLCIKNPILCSESGFSIVELLYTMFISSVLSAIAVVSYSNYKENAEYQKVESTLRNARTALVAGEQDVDNTYSLALTDTGTAGGPVHPLVQEILPGLVTDSDVVLTVAYNSCPAGGGAGLLKAVLISKPCKAEHYSQWLIFCDGIEIENRHQVNPVDFC